MKTKKLQSVDEIFRVIEKNWNDNDNTMLPPMFHGTDASLISLAKSERDQLNTACETVIFELLKLFKANSIKSTDKRLMNSRDSYGNSSDAFIKAEGRLNKSPLYSYGDFYVTNNPQRAIGYSKEAWIYGETGWVANRLIEGSWALGLKLPDDTSFNYAMQLLDKRKQREKAPIVLMFINRTSSELRNEDGSSSEDLQKMIKKD